MTTIFPLCIHRAIPQGICCVRSNCGVYSNWNTLVVAAEDDLIYKQTTQFYSYLQFPNSLLLLLLAVVLGCSKSRGPNTSTWELVRLLQSFEGNFFFHLEKVVGMVKNDIIIRYSLMASKLLPSIKIIV